MSCTCQGCNEQFRVGLMLPDGLWVEVRKKRIDVANALPVSKGLLCPYCIVDTLEDMGYGMYFLEPDPTAKRIDNG